MGLKIYEREHKQFRRFTKLFIATPEYAKELLQEMSNHFGVSVPDLVTTGRGRQGTHFKGGKGRYLFPTIRVSMNHLSYDILIHEFAHHLNLLQDGQHGHKGKFWDRLCQVYEYGQKWMRR